MWHNQVKAVPQWSLLLARSSGRRLNHSVNVEPMSERIPITPSISLDVTELSEEFIRSSGPGGQNVNKVATAVQLRFDAAASPNLPEDVRTRLIALAGRRADEAGLITIVARRSRTQADNRMFAREQLVDLIRRAARPPTARRATRPSAAERTRRLERKRQRSEVKQSRRTRPGDVE